MGKGLIASFSMLLDPGSGAETARNEKWAWVLPLVLLAIVAAVVAWIVVPLSMEVMLKNPPEGMSREQLTQMQERMKSFSGIGVFLAPLMTALMTAVGAALILLLCSVMGMKATFGELFNLTAMAGMVKVIHSAAMAAVLKLKGDSIESAADLVPAFGVDIFLPDGTNKFVRAMFNYFSVFEIWYIIVLALGVAAMYKVSKGKGFGAVTLAWIFPLMFALAGAAFR